MRPRAGACRSTCNVRRSHRGNVYYRLHRSTLVAALLLPRRGIEVAGLPSKEGLRRKVRPRSAPRRKCPRHAQRRSVRCHKWQHHDGRHNNRYSLAASHHAQRARGPSRTVALPHKDAPHRRHERRQVEKRQIERPQIDRRQTVTRPIPK